jgi:hypothetical protein
MFYFAKKIFIYKINYIVHVFFFIKNNNKLAKQNCKEPLKYVFPIQYKFKKLV